MTLPPPLPTHVAAAALSSTQSSDARAAKFVSMTAKMSLALGGLAVLWSLLQLMLSYALQQTPLPGAMQGTELQIPSGLRFIVEHATALSFAMLAVSVAFMLIAWYLLQRRAWARIAFIAFLIITALANFGGVALVHGFYSDMTLMFPAEFYQEEQGQLFLQQMQTGKWTSLIFGALAALSIAALHGWLARKFNQPDIRAQFR